MKIMTLNTHSLAEPEYESKLAAFAGSLVQIKPDIIALQEVNQSRSAPPAASGRLRESGYVPCCAKDLSTASPCASRAESSAQTTTPLTWRCSWPGPVFPTSGPGLRPR